MTAQLAPPPIPGTPDVPDAPSPLPRNYVQIGDFELGDGTDAQCVLTIKPKSDSKVDKKEADGKSGAVTTWKGAKPTEWEIDIAWITRHATAHDAILEILYQLSPVGPNPGKAQQFAHASARIHGTDNVIVENVEGPDYKPGTDEATAKLKVTSWKKPAATAQGQGASKTDTDPTKWAGGAGGSGAGQAGGTGQNTWHIGAAGTPSVVPDKAQTG
jgi:hypothetical protein